MHADDPGSSRNRRSAVDAQQFVRVSMALREAFAAVAAAELPEDQRGRWQRRLLSITDAARRDLVRAAEQLDRFKADWERRGER